MRNVTAKLHRVYSKTPALKIKISAYIMKDRRNQAKT